MPTAGLQSETFAPPRRLTPGAPHAHRRRIEDAAGAQLRPPHPRLTYSAGLLEAIVVTVGEPTVTTGVPDGERWKRPLGT